MPASHIHFKEEMQARALMSWKVVLWRDHFRVNGWAPGIVLIVVEDPDRPGHYWGTDGRHRIFGINMMGGSDEFQLPTIRVRHDFPHTASKEYGVWINRVGLFGSDCSMADLLLQIKHYYDLALEKAAEPRPGRPKVVHAAKVLELMSSDMKNVKVLDKDREAQVIQAVTVLKKVRGHLHTVELLHVRPPLLYYIILYACLTTTTHCHTYSPPEAGLPYDGRRVVPKQDL